MSAPPVSTELAHGAPHQASAAPSGSALAKDFQQTYGQGAAAGQQDQPGGHYNPITKRWERDDEHVVSSTQSGSTGPEGAEDIGEQVKKPSFKDQVMGSAKLFGGKVRGKDHEVAAGEALLAGKGLDEAQRVEQATKQS